MVKDSYVEVNRVLDEELTGSTHMTHNKYSAYLQDPFAIYHNFAMLLS